MGNSAHLIPMSRTTPIPRLVPRDPSADPRTRLHLDIVAGILNDLLRNGELVLTYQTDPVIGTTPVYTLANKDRPVLLLDQEQGNDEFPFPGPPGPPGGIGPPGTGIPGLDGEQGEDGVPIPGIAGVSGAAGQSIPGLDGEPGEDGVPLPGIPGTAGAAGAAGSAGAPGQFMPCFDGEPGEDGFPIPGPVGATGTGATGGMGPPGLSIPCFDGEPGEDGATIPGAPGTSGGGSPGGSDKQVQYNNSGAFDGASGVTWDQANKVLHILGYAGAADIATFDGVLDTVYLLPNEAANSILVEPTAIYIGNPTGSPTVNIAITSSGTVNIGTGAGHPQIAIAGSGGFIGFFGATPAAQQTGDIGTALVTLGLVSGFPLFAYANLTGAPSALPPNGSAGGDLTGTYPNPTIANVTCGAPGVPYTPAVTGNWNVPPTTVQQALDKLAAWIAANSTVFTALGITTQP